MTIEKSYGQVEIDGVVKRMSDLTDEEFTRFMRRCATRLQRAMQDYINAIRSVSWWRAKYGAMLDAAKLEGRE